MLINRQKCVLYVLQELKQCTRIQLAKILFLLEKETKIPVLCPFYSFIPYKYGPYSFELFHDIDAFEKENFISKTETTISYTNKQITIPPSLKHAINDTLSTYRDMDEKKLITYVYQQYPEYTIFSKIDKYQQYNRDQTGIFTIGYQGKSIDTFLHTLISEKTHTLFDIRHNPWSMKYGFTKNTLQTLCEKLQINYCHIPELGIPGNMRQSLDTKKDYDELFQKYTNHLKNQLQQMNMLKQQSKTKRIALMCFEEDPSYCHRHILGEHLQQMDARVTIT